MEVHPLTVKEQHPTTTFGAIVEMGSRVGVVLRFGAATNRIHIPYSTGGEQVHFAMVNAVIVKAAISA